MSRIAEYKQIDTKVVTETVVMNDHDDYGEVIGHHEEIITKEVPVMGVVYRDATPQEEAAAEAEAALQAEIEANREPTEEERLRADVDFLLAMGGMIV